MSRADDLRAFCTSDFLMQTSAKRKEVWGLSIKHASEYNHQYLYYLYSYSCYPGWSPRKNLITNLKGSCKNHSPRMEELFNDVIIKDLLCYCGMWVRLIWWDPTDKNIFFHITWICESWDTNCSWHEQMIGGDYHLPELGKFTPERFLDHYSCVNNEILYDTNKLVFRHVWRSVSVLFIKLINTDKPFHLWSRPGRYFADGLAWLSMANAGVVFYTSPTLL